MRHRIKKIPTLSKLHHKCKLNHLLHSDKSDKHTYFYKGKVRDFFKSRLTPTQPCTNGIRCASPHHDLDKSITDLSRVNRTRSSRETTSYSAMAGRTVGTIPLVLSAFGLLLVLGLMISPLSSVSGVEEVYAEEGINAQMEVPVSGVALEIDTTLPEDNTIVEQVNSSGTKYISVNFTVRANDIDKYQVYVQADNTNLTGSTSKDVISSVSTPTLGSDIGAKQWGYSVAKNHNVDTNTLTYNTIQTNVSTPADTVEAGSGSKLTNITQPYTLAFAANLDGAKADHYKSNITLSVAANAEEVTTSTEFLGFYGINYMQDMTPAICEKARVGEVARLIDKRDQKLYWIGKLADNNCWMTQNLDFDLEGVTLIPETSDVKSEWTSTSGPGNDVWVQGGGGEGAIARNDVRYYDPGEYVLTKPTIRPDDSCGMLDSTLCEADGWVNVSGMSSSNVLQSALGIIDGKYNAHYLSGNYYTWAAVTAGQAAEFTDGVAYPVNATQSICPKGWTLPEHESVIEDSRQEKTYSRLLNSYGVQKGLKFGAQDMRLAPLYLLQAGFVGDNTLKKAASVGAYWQKTTNAHTGAYDLGSDGFVNLGMHSLRSWGQSVRCVAR